MKDYKVKTTRKLILQARKQLKKSNKEDFSSSSTPREFESDISAESLQDPNATKTCSICYQDFPEKSEAFVFDNERCLNCCRYCLEFALNDISSFPLKKSNNEEWPLLTESFHPRIVNKLFNSDKEKNRYNEFSLKTFMTSSGLKNPLVCPSCKAIFFPDQNGCRHFKCTSCQADFCISCNNIIDSVNEHYNGEHPLFTIEDLVNFDNLPNLGNNNTASNSNNNYQHIEEKVELFYCPNCKAPSEIDPSYLGPTPCPFCTLMICTKHKCRFAKCANQDHSF